MNTSGKKNISLQDQIVCRLFELLDENHVLDEKEFRALKVLSKQDSLNNVDQIIKIINSGGE